MLTRLFNNISVQAGIIAFISLIVLNTAGIYLIDIQDVTLSFGEHKIVFGTSIIRLFYVLISSFVPIIYATNVNSLGVFPGSFQKSILFGISFLLLIELQFSIELILALPFILLAFQKLFKIGNLADPRPLLFDIGVIAGFVSLFFVEAIVLIAFCWLAILVFRTFNVKTILIPVVGLFAAYTLAFFVSFIWDGFEFLNILKHQYQKIEWGFIDYDFGVLLNLLGLLFLGLVSMINVLKSIVKATVFKRQVITLCIGLILLSILLASSQKSSVNLLAFMIFPLSILLYDFLLSLKKWWQKDLIYLVLIFNLVLVLI